MRGCTLEYNAKSAHLSGLDAQVDGSTLRGNAAVTNLTTGAMTFDLTIDQIDLDRYLSPPSKSAKPAVRPAPPAPADLIIGPGGTAGRARVRSIASKSVYRDCTD